MKEFEFKELDMEGQATLEAIAGADAFNEWMYKTISKNLEGDILEIGSGIGNISSFFIRDNKHIHLSDIRENYCAFLQKKFKGKPGFMGVKLLDLVHPDFEDEYAGLIGRFDGAFALNVIEHIKEDDLAIRNCYKLLRPGGRLIILVPAYQFLYNHFDKALEHYRRYNKKMLTGLLSVNGFRVAHAYYFNLAGIPGWFVSGALMKNKVIPSGQMKLYNTLVPVFKIMDKVTLNQMGLSVVAEGVKE